MHELACTRDRGVYRTCFNTLPRVAKITTRNIYSKVDPNSFRDRAISYFSSFIVNFIGDIYVYMHIYVYIYAYIYTSQQ